MDLLSQLEYIKEAPKQFTPRLQESLEKWIHRGCRWILYRIMNIQINISNYRPLHAGYYLPLPKEVWATEANVNVKNQNNDGLSWSLGAALFPVNNHPERTTTHPLNDNLNFKW